MRLVTALQLMTPTHWMYVSGKNKKFEHAMGGAYTMKGGKCYPSLDVASFPKKLWGKTEWTQKVEGDKLSGQRRQRIPPTAKNSLGKILLRKRSSGLF